MTWGCKVPKGIEDFPVSQAFLVQWGTKDQKDRKGRRAAWVILAWKVLWDKEVEKGYQGLEESLDHLDLEKKETEVLQVLQGHLVPQVLLALKVQWVLQAPRVLQVLLAFKDLEEKQVSQVLKVRRALLDPQDPKVIRVRKELVE